EAPLPPTRPDNRILAEHGESAESSRDGITIPQARQRHNPTDRFHAFTYNDASRAESASFYTILSMIPRSSPAEAVVVVGAGPAGATAAWALASNGVRVQLLDRSVFPRNKPCGAGISMRVLPRFPHLAREL